MQIVLHISLKLAVILFQLGQFRNLVVNVGVNSLRDLNLHIFFKIKLHSALFKTQPLFNVKSFCLIEASLRILLCKHIHQRLCLVQSAV